MVVQTVIQMRLKPFEKLILLFELPEAIYNSWHIQIPRAKRERGGEGEVGSKSEDISYQSYPPLSA